jgi:hypothetical protein
MQRYSDPNVKKEEAWEEHWIRNATLKWNIWLENKRYLSDDYQYVFQGQIDVIKAWERFRGNRSVLEALQGERKNLPIHPFYKLFMITKYLSLLMNLVPIRLHIFPNIFTKLVTQSMEEWLYLHVLSHDVLLLWVLLLASLISQ